MHYATFLLDEDPDVLIRLESFGQLPLGRRATTTRGRSCAFGCGAHHLYSHPCSVAARQEACSASSFEFAREDCFN
ncbi:hypothetical protein ACVWW2_001901 [Bradyrhizobium sp. LM4.3]